MGLHYCGKVDLKGRSNIVRARKYPNEKDDMREGPELRMICSVIVG